MKQIEGDFRNWRTGNSRKYLQASKIAIDSGADFIKHQLEKLLLIPQKPCCDAYCHKEHYDKTGKMVGIKPAGGIAEPKDSLLYIKLVYYILRRKMDRQHNA